MTADDEPAQERQLCKSPPEATLLMQLLLDAECAACIASCCCMAMSLTGYVRDAACRNPSLKLSSAGTH